MDIILSKQTVEVPAFSLPFTTPAHHTHCSTGFPYQKKYPTELPTPKEWHDFDGNLHAIFCKYAQTRLVEHQAEPGHISQDVAGKLSGATRGCKHQSRREWCDDGCLVHTHQMEQVEQAQHLAAAATARTTPHNQHTVVRNRAEAPHHTLSVFTKEHTNTREEPQVRIPGSNHFSGQRHKDPEKPW